MDEKDMTLTEAVDHIRMNMIDTVGMKNGLLFVRVGSDQFPATQNDLSRVTEALSEIACEKDITCLVAGHAFDVKLINIDDPETKVLFIRVGTDKHPASEEDLARVERNIKDVFSGCSFPKIAIMPHTCDM